MLYEVFGDLAFSYTDGIGLALLPKRDHNGRIQEDVDSMYIDGNREVFGMKSPIQRATTYSMSSIASFNETSPWKVFVISQSKRSLKSSTIGHALNDFRISQENTLIQMTEEETEQAEAKLVADLYKDAPIETEYCLAAIHEETQRILFLGKDSIANGYMKHMQKRYKMNFSSVLSDTEIGYVLDVVKHETLTIADQFVIETGKKGSFKLYGDSTDRKGYTVNINGSDAHDFWLKQVSAGERVLLNSAEILIHDHDEYHASLADQNEPIPIGKGKAGLTKISDIAFNAGMLISDDQDYGEDVEKLTARDPHFMKKVDPAELQIQLSMALAFLTAIMRSEYYYDQDGEVSAVH